MKFAVYRYPRTAQQKIRCTVRDPDGFIVTSRRFDEKKWKVWTYTHNKFFFANTLREAVVMWRLMQ